jgi:predicted transcriptional regulator
MIESFMIPILQKRQRRCKVGRNLQQVRFSLILEPMNIHFTPEQEAQLAQIATQEGTDAERLVKEAAVRLLEEDARFRAAVQEGIAQADRGEFIEEEEMDARLEQMLRS